METPVSNNETSYSNNTESAASAMSESNFPKREDSKTKLSAEDRFKKILHNREKGTTLRVTSEDIANLNKNLRSIINGLDVYGDGRVLLADLNIKISFDLDIKEVKKHCISSEFRELQQKLSIKTVEHVKQRKDYPNRKIKEDLYFLSGNQSDITDDIKA